MRSFWLWFVFLSAALLLAVLQENADGSELARRMLFSALLLAAYFAAPLLRRKPAALTALLCGAAVFAAIALWPSDGQGHNPYPLLVFALLAGKAAYRLPGGYAVIVGAFSLAGAVAPALLGKPGYPPMFLLLFAIAFGIVAYLAGTMIGERDEATARSEALLSEYRMMKRRLATSEEEARQDERTQVAREIHDSVGHKLTALMMQIEMHRLSAEAESKEMLAELKVLAKESLEETRSAVKTLNEEEGGGLAAILRLLRKLEAESLMRIEFTVKDGALTAPLVPAQSIAIYRALQEALTNAMRHGAGREAKISFEAPGGGSVFRFEVTNPVKQGGAFFEGFGLRGMRERIKETGGQLEVSSFAEVFIVRGTYSLVDREGEIK
ncbi:sensor histidine kinase [Paenibacillus sp. PAMC21692]|uniref:sensor histidine kinase n=1 Tax=Paenibacillus sp. PAMC21692 TaxID=2762320 RepID=UPI00164D6FF5|nr:sensor histidine kinase [Paenibacillus sp. PAMC21692]QNK55717.1 sensor histidine kinase [Paenibacillus sp. PAMC21692]